MSRVQAGDVRATGWLLVAANLVPIYGVFVHGWEVFPLILLYWLENLWLGALHLVRIAATPLGEDVPPLASLAGKAFFMPFFAIHYGGFCMVHGVFVFAMFSDGLDPFGMGFFPNVDGIMEAVRTYHLELPLLALAISHLVSLVRHVLLAGERHSFEDGSAALMGSIYGRIVVLHLAILFGSFFVLALGSPAIALVLLVLLKAAFDLNAHRREHEQAAARLADRRD
jgi:hypothetical protein